jgi:hypothetical protein
MCYMPASVQYVREIVDWMAFCYLSGLCCPGYSNRLAIDLLSRVLAPGYLIELTKVMLWAEIPRYISPRLPSMGLPPPSGRLLDLLSNLSASRLQIWRMMEPVVLFVYFTWRQMPLLKSCYSAAHGRAAGHNRQSTISRRTHKMNAPSNQHVYICSNQAGEIR